MSKSSVTDWSDGCYREIRKLMPFVGLSNGSYPQVKTCASLRENMHLGTIGQDLKIISRYILMNGRLRPLSKQRANKSKKSGSISSWNATRPLGFSTTSTKRSESNGYFDKFEFGVAGHNWSGWICTRYVDRLRKSFIWQRRREGHHNASLFSLYFWTRSFVSFTQSCHHLDKSRSVLNVTAVYPTVNPAFEDLAVTLVSKASKTWSVLSVMRVQK